CQHYYSYPTF
nr:immunoglobulin light chain junction region [Macaca mulatta]MOV64610.1 immunoglobulin light chain junction region [Macaca mulatta]MOW39078.1 immunoglobulin light chain junction region [Macaca mulatta]